MKRVWENLKEGLKIAVGIPGVLVLAPVATLAFIGLAASYCLENRDNRQEEMKKAKEYDDCTWIVDDSRKDENGLQFLYLHEARKESVNVLLCHVAPDCRFYDRWKVLKRGDRVITRFVRKPTQNLMSKGVDITLVPDKIKYLMPELQSV